MSIVCRENVELAPSLVTEVITDTEQFRELRAEWTELLQDSGSDCLFLSWEWMFSWWQHLSSSRKLHLITVRDRGMLVAIAPLTLCPPNFKRLRPCRALEFLASGTVGSDYLSFLIRRGYEEVALAEIGASLTKANVMLELVRVESTSFVMTATALELKQAGWRPMRQTTNYSPFINLKGHTWDSYCETLAYSHRRDIRRKLANLKKTFNVRFERVETEEQRVDAMARFIDLHLTRWADDGGSTALESEALKQFHLSLSKVALERGWLRLYTLWLDDRPGAIVYLFRYADTFYYYQASFDKEFGKYGVGMLTLAMAIKAACEEGAAEFDFLHDDELYKYLWAREERELIRLDLFPPKYSGAAIRNAAILKSEIKRVLAGFTEMAK
jgi:Protein of unknown function, DUF482.